MHGRMAERDSRNMDGRCPPEVKMGGPEFLVNIATVGSIVEHVRSRATNARHTSGRQKENQATFGLFTTRVGQRPWKDGSSKHAYLSNWERVDIATYLDTREARDATMYSTISGFDWSHSKAWYF